MKISVKLTRAENTALLGAGPVELDLEEYLCGVVPSEIYESSHMEALKAPVSYTHLPPADLWRE